MLSLDIDNTRESLISHNDQPIVHHYMYSWLTKLFEFYGIRRKSNKNSGSLISCAAILSYFAIVGGLIAVVIEVIISIEWNKVVDWMECLVLSATFLFKVICFYYARHQDKTDTSTDLSRESVEIQLSTINIDKSHTKFDDLYNYGVCKCLTDHAILSIVFAVAIIIHIGQIFYCSIRVIPYVSWYSSSAAIFIACFMYAVELYLRTFSCMKMLEICIMTLYEYIIALRAVLIIFEQNCQATCTDSDDVHSDPNSA